MKLYKLILLFILRLTFYFSVIILIHIHPSVAVSFDSAGIVLWSILIPSEAIIAFIPGLKFKTRCIAALSVLILLSFFAGGINAGFFTLFFAGLASFVLTFLLFHQNTLKESSLFRITAKLASFEPVFFAYICLRLISLSRSGEDIAQQSIFLTQFIFIWTAVVFLFHSLIVYMCLYPGTSARKEGVILFITAIASLFAVLVVLPQDFVRNAVIENLNMERVPQRIREGSEQGLPRDAQNRREGRRTLPLDGSGSGREPGLQGISEFAWSNRTDRGRGEGDGEPRQYMVKIVVSGTEPVYMGNSFRGTLDPVLGFTVSQEEPLNRIVNQRFFVTWFNHEPDFDIGRSSQEVYSLSTLSQKYVPWRPITIDPTILNENSGPLRFIHEVVSDMHINDPLFFINIPSRPLNAFERRSLEHYLELPLNNYDMEIFEKLLNEKIAYWRQNRSEIVRRNNYLSGIFYDIESEPVNESMEIILALMTGFSDYQYNLSYDDNADIESIINFLINTKEGDCVEFSNSLALLGRIAGIPSRVVTGYIAAEDLQTPAHLRGLYALRGRIPFLQQFPFENLFMVTNLHSHSWTQFYLPDYGWIDFEATMFSIPPEGTGDFNSWDVVIPLLDENRVFRNVRSFPWRALLRAAGFLLVFSLICAYLLRYGREIILCLGIKKGGREGARALYLLLLSVLAADGKPIKPASKTAAEYTELFGNILTQRRSGTEDIRVHQEYFKNFAVLYSELRWREFEDKNEMENKFELLKQEYRNIIKTTKSKGIGRRFIRIISLRGLAYL